MIAVLGNAPITLDAFVEWYPDIGSPKQTTFVNLIFDGESS